MDQETYFYSVLVRDWHRNLAPRSASDEIAPGWVLYEHLLVELEGVVACCPVGRSGQYWHQSSVSDNCDFHLLFIPWLWFQETGLFLA
jgi:hypothetical protein